MDVVDGWNDNAGSGGHAIAIRRSARYMVDERLVVEIGADDNFEHLGDGGFNDVVIGRVSRDPAHTLLEPIANPYTFTPGKDAVRGAPDDVVVGDRRAAVGQRGVPGKADLTKLSSRYSSPADRRSACSS